MRARQLVMQTQLRRSWTSKSRDGNGEDGMQQAHGVVDHDGSAPAHRDHSTLATSVRTRRQRANPGVRVNTQSMKLPVFVMMYQGSEGKLVALCYTARSLTAKI